jgi:Zn finger protein HypA/HybF involved in hydrogenase expression
MDKETTKHGETAGAGRCRDCAQGMLSQIRDGFEYFDEEGDGRGFWFCRHCGSNHVTVVLQNGVTVEQGDLY